MRIVHAFGMVIGSALAFTMYRGLSSHLNERWKPFGELYVIVMGSAVGVMLAGGLTLARRWRQGDSTVMSQPGHWLLAFGIAVFLANAGAIAPYYGWYYVAAPLEVIRPPFWMPFREAFAPSLPGIIHQAVCWGLTGTAALLFCVGSFHRLRWRWCALFPVVFLCGLYLTVGYVAAFIGLWGSAGAISWCRQAARNYAEVIVFCSLIVALGIVRDARQARRGDFLHWTGVLVWSVISAMQLCLYFRY